ncbi:MAG: hypothetical protein EOM83_02425 [Clostridia bacterium]|nr:hypothetical protein [Clostridia bacterium]
MLTAAHSACRRKRILRKIIVNLKIGQNKDENYRPQIFDNFEGTLRDTDERLFQWIGTETGVDVKYYFKKIDGKWFLIKKENLGD